MQATPTNTEGSAAQSVQWLELAQSKVSSDVTRYNVNSHWYGRIFTCIKSTRT